MKSLTLMLFITVSSFGQMNNFAVLKNKLVWENVFISNQPDIAALLNRHPSLKITSSGNHLYKGKGTQVSNTCLGVSSFLEQKFDFDFEIESADGKYRVTVYNLTTKKNSFEQYLVEKGVLNTSKKDDLACLDSFFNRIFTMTSIYKNKP